MTTSFKNDAGTGIVEADGFSGPVDPTDIPEATETTSGVVKMAAFVADPAGAEPTAEEFEALRDALVAAGLMAPNPNP